MPSGAFKAKLLDSWHRKVCDGQSGQQKPGVARPMPLRLGTPPAASPPKERPPQRGAPPVRTPPVGSSVAPLILESRV